LSGYAIHAYARSGEFKRACPRLDAFAFGGVEPRQGQSKDRTIMADLLYIGGGIAILGVFALYAYALRRI
jgi:hypothetical protein